MLSPDHVGPWPIRFSAARLVLQREDHGLRVLYITVLMVYSRSLYIPLHPVSHADKSPPVSLPPPHFPSSSRDSNRMTPFSLPVCVQELYLRFFYCLLSPDVQRQGALPVSRYMRLVAPVLSRHVACIASLLSVLPFSSSAQIFFGPRKVHDRVRFSKHPFARGQDNIVPGKALFLPWLQSQPIRRRMSSSRFEPLPLLAVPFDLLLRYLLSRIRRIRPFRCTVRVA